MALRLAIHRYRSDAMQSWTQIRWGTSSLFGPRISAEELPRFDQDEHTYSTSNTHRHWWPVPSKKRLDTYDAEDFTTHGLSPPGTETTRAGQASGTSIAVIHADHFPRRDALVIDKKRAPETVPRTHFTLVGHAVFTGIVGSVVAMTFAFVALAANHSVSRQIFPLSYWQSRVHHVLRPTVYDSRGDIAGFIPPVGFHDLHSSHAAIPDAIPTHCIDLVLRAEDAHHASGWRQYLGVDLVSIFRAAVTFTGGGSNLPAQVARQLGGWHRYGVAERKLREWGASQTIIELVGGDHRKLASLYLSIAPFAARTHGDIRGITAIADAMWGIRPSQLSVPQCALLVSMLPQRPSLLATDDKAQTVWQKRKQVAAGLLRKQYGDKTTHVEVIADMGSFPPRRAAIPDQPDSVTLNLGARTQVFVLPNLRRIEEDSRGAEQ